MNKIVARLFQVLLLAAATARAEWYSIGKVTSSQAEGSRIT